MSEPSEHDEHWAALTRHLDRALGLTPPSPAEADRAMAAAPETPPPPGVMERVSERAPSEPGESVVGLARRDAITELVERSREGDSEARNALYDRVYEQLHRIAARQQRRWPGVGDTLRPTVLVSELFVEFDRRFPDVPRDRPEDRAWFYGCAANAMRNILKKHWKRVASKHPLPIGERDPAGDPSEWGAADFLDLDAAFERLREYNERWYRIAMLKYFGGRTIEQISDLVGRSKAVVKDDWAWCKRWLKRELDSMG